MSTEDHRFSFSMYVSLLWEAFASTIGWYCTLIGPVVMYIISVYIAKYFSLDKTLTIITIFSIIELILVLIFLKFPIEEYFDKERRSLDAFAKHLEKTKEANEREYSTQMKLLESQETKLRTLIISTSPFKDSASLAADVESQIFDESSKYLRYKKHPATSAANEVKRMKNIYHQAIEQYKQLLYKHEFVLSIFPDIKEYMQNDEDLLALSEYYSYSNFDDLRDRRKDYMSSEEYKKLSEDSRSQLALDRYISSRNKSKWQIGRDYEMNCAYYLQQQGYIVDMHGINNKMNDLGRDLIAIKQQDSLSVQDILIIQCKNWSSDHEIHENVIMQLFGTAYEYKLSMGNPTDTKVIPILMTPEHTKISEVARQFAKKLQVSIRVVPFTNFPRIKCNINNGHKIYHLPFDQQYDRTQIKLKGECYVNTVAEAVALGFRRAKRHIPTNVDS